MKYWPRKPAPPAKRMVLSSKRFASGPKLSIIVATSSCIRSDKIGVISFPLVELAAHTDKTPRSLLECHRNIHTRTRPERPADGSQDALSRQSECVFPV